MRKVLLIVNPSSGNEKAKEYSALAIKKLETLFDEVEVKYTEKGGDAKNFAMEASKKRIDSVFVMGGDGTVNEGISGLAEQEYRPNFGFFPLGTVNDLSRALDIPLDPKEAIENLDLSVSKKIDIGKINDNYFMNVVAIGVIPEAINDVESEQKTKFGKMAYFISGIKKLKDTTSYDFKIETDGVEKTFTGSLILIGLTNSIGGFESILPEAEVNDGKLHMIYLKDESMFDALKALPSLITGVDEGNDNLGYIVFEKGRVQIESDAELSTNVDGDEGDKLPIKVKVLKSHINVYCG